jgi:hypothetical protein
LLGLGGLFLALGVILPERVEGVQEWDLIQF